MATDDYTPTDEDMRKRHRHAWEQSEIARHALDEADAQWSRWLAAHDARVRRDAARKALDGLAAEVRLEWHERHHWVLQPIDDYRNDIYPEDVTP